MIYIILAVVILLALLFVFVYRKKEKKLKPMTKGAVFGGIIGMLAGITLVEFWGYDYPLPFILFLLGMAAGQVVEYFCQRGK